jgi:hypothetical protein
MLTKTGRASAAAGPPPQRNQSKAQRPIIPHVLCRVVIVLSLESFSKRPDFSILARFAKTARHPSPPFPLPPFLSDPKVECNPIAFFEVRPYKAMPKRKSLPLKQRSQRPDRPHRFGPAKGQRDAAVLGRFFQPMPGFLENPHRSAPAGIGKPFRRGYNGF